MDMADIATSATVVILLAAVLAAWLRERRRSRTLLGVLHAEAHGLCAEAAGLAEALARRQADGEPIDPLFLDMHALSEPQTWPGLVSSAGLIPLDIAGRAADLHGHLALARARLAGWRSGPRDSAGAGLIVETLLHAANGGEGLLREIEARLGWPHRWTPHMPAAHAFITTMEDETPEVFDWPYWSDPQ